MNLSILPINVMLAQSWRWLTTPEIRQALAAHPMGAALLVEIEKVHNRLAEQSERRRQLEATLQRLTDLVTRYDAVHDNLARAIHGALEAIALGTQNPERAAACRRLQSILLPEGLSIVSRSYIYEAGAIEALLRRVTDEVKAELAAIPVGGDTLADWFHAWVAAGQALGRHVQERAHLLKSTGRGGTGTAEVGNQEARRRWIGTVQTFVSALDLMELGAETRERILSALEASIDSALRARPGSDPEGDEPEGDEDEDAPGEGDGDGDDLGDGEPDQDDGDDLGSGEPDPDDGDGDGDAPAPGDGDELGDDEPAADERAPSA